jgi:uncharacterized protein involved in propanediol utilization
MSLIQIQTGANIGEIAQGALSPACPFLVSNLTSSQFCSVTFLKSCDRQIFDLGEKASAACYLFLERLRSKCSGSQPDLASFHIWQQSNIPPGKGLSSSSADVLGALSALNKFYEYPFSAADLYSVAALTDPTDACLSPVLTVINQQTGKIMSNLKHLRFSLIYFDTEPNTRIDTIQFTRSKIFTQQDYRFYRQLLQKLSFTTDNENSSDFLFWITQSAVYNQKFLPKKNFNLLLSYSMKQNLGLFVAHSGTFMGLVVPGDIPENLWKQSVEFIRSGWKTDAFSETFSNTI